MNKKKIMLLIGNIQNNIDALKLELDEESIEDVPKNAIHINELIKAMHSDGICEDFEAVEESFEAPDNFLGGKREREFYERFNLGE